MSRLHKAVVIAAGLVFATAGIFQPAAAQPTDCKNRGQLDTLYCDDNNDLVADAPQDQKK